MMAKYLYVILVMLCESPLYRTAGIKVTLNRCEKRMIMTNERNEEVMLIKTAENIGNVIGMPSEVCEMRLSHGNMTLLPFGIFQNFTRLMKLSLAGNNIHKIADKAFVGLSFLKTLDLSNNPLQEWNTSGISIHTPRLMSLDMTSSFPGITLPWKPAMSLFKLPDLSKIAGVSWSQSCSNCTLLRTSNETQLRFYGNITSMFIEEYACRYKTTTPSQFIRGLAINGFLALCVLNNHECFQSEVKVVTTAPCRATACIMLLEYVFGPVAMVLNVIVIVTVMKSKRLYRNHDMLLVTNIAIGDFCTGLYSLVIVSVHQNRTFDKLEIFVQSYCKYIGFFWVLGLGLSVSFSLVLTIERFKCVVQSRNRQSRMSANEIIVASSLCWMTALTAAILPLFGIGNYHVNTYCVPVFPTSNDHVQFYYSIALSGTSAIMYIASIPLYSKMYFFVRKSSKNMRVRADIELAKRVFSLVLTNMTFLFVPIIISLVFARVKRSTSQLSREVSEVVNAALPLLCLTINSALNPILYSFRSRSFRKEVLSSTCGIYPSTDTSSSTFKSGNARSTVIQRETQQATSLSILKEYKTRQCAL